MDTKKELVTDADTLLNRWTGLKRLCNTRIFLSASNFLLLKTLFAISLEAIADIDLKQLNDYMFEHKALAFIIDDKNINEGFNSFLANENTYMNTITISKTNNLELVIFKGFYLDKTDDTDIAPTIDETVAYMEFRKQSNRALTLYSLNDEILDFCEEFKFDFDIRDAR